MTTTEATFICVNCRHPFVEHFGQVVIFASDTLPGIACRRCADKGGLMLATEPRIRENWTAQIARLARKKGHPTC